MTGQWREVMKTTVEVGEVHPLPPPGVARRPSGQSRVHHGLLWQHLTRRRLVIERQSHFCDRSFVFILLSYLPAFATHWWGLEDVKHTLSFIMLSYLVIVFTYVSPPNDTFYVSYKRSFIILSYYFMVGKNILIGTTIDFSYVILVHEPMLC